MQVKNIIFDLGGVLLNIDFKKTAEAFTKLGVKNFDSYYTQFHVNPLFKQLETGHIINESFYDELRKTASIQSGNATIDAAWNAMLLNFPAERIEKLKTLSTQYAIFLFSNTNAIHHAFFINAFYNEYGFNFDSLFKKAYYSHLIGYRKPAIEAFTFVVNDAGINAAETLFIDDTLPNADAAQQAGLQAAYLPPGKNVIQLLQEVL
jgi:glucose-1-phosphatase